MNLALFDFDGTLTTVDTWVRFFPFALSRTRLVTGALAASPFTASYAMGLVSASRARVAVTRAAFASASAEAVRASGRAYAHERLPAFLRADALERLRWHQQQGDVVAVVSGGLDVYLQPWCNAQGVECLCSTLEEREGRLTGRYVGGDCVGAEKARRVQRRFELRDFTQVYAYGNTEEDRAMLDLAHRRFYRGIEEHDRRS